MGGLLAFWDVERGRALGAWRRDLRLRANLCLEPENPSGVAFAEDGARFALFEHDSNPRRVVEWAFVGKDWQIRDVAIPGSMSGAPALLYGRTALHAVFADERHRWLVRWHDGADPETFLLWESPGIDAQWAASLASRYAIVRDAAGTLGLYSLDEERVVSPLPSDTPLGALVWTSPRRDSVIIVMEGGLLWFRMGDDPRKRSLRLYRVERPEPDHAAHPPSDHAHAFTSLDEFDALSFSFESSQGIVAVTPDGLYGGEPRAVSNWRLRVGVDPWTAPLIQGSTTEAHYRPNLIPEYLAGTEAR